MSEHKIISIGLAALFAALLGMAAHDARADDAVSISLTIKNHLFDPAETHAPANKQIVFHVKNLNDIVSEFESSELHFEKIVPVGKRRRGLCPSTQAGAIQLLRRLPPCHAGLPGGAISILP